MPHRPKLSHLNPKGQATMVDVGSKPITSRRAIAQGFITLSPATLKAITQSKVPKGEVLSTARIAAIQAAKRTADLIPLCHPLALDAITIDFAMETKRIRITATASISAKTGVEMEALTAVAVAALTIYDMCKAIDKTMTITNIRLLSKTGGTKS
jgi:cyclic pyranopterin monophosphate synthase